MMWPSGVAELPACGVGAVVLLPVVRLVFRTEGPVARPYGRLVVVAGRKQDTAFFALQTGSHADVQRLAVARARDAPVDFEFKPLCLSPCNDIDNASHRVRTIHRRRAVLEHLDALNGGSGNGVEIDG